MERLKFSVVIPTRERADTLYHTIRTCVSQDYDNLEIIVSDNASNDNTRDVVLSFKDKRITYINTGKRISMSDNFEFALSHVKTEGYVIYIGDDDGLLPNAIHDINAVIVDTGAQVLRWDVPSFFWATLKMNKANQLHIPSLGSGITIRDSATTIQNVLSFKAPYQSLPLMYIYSAVEYEVIRRIKSLSGRFYHSMTPDVYSGFAIAGAVDSFINSKRSYAIGGASHHSIGASAMGGSRSSGVLQKYLNENNAPFHSSLVISTSLQEVIIENFLQARDYLPFFDKFTMHMEQLLFEMMKEAAVKPQNYYMGIKDVVLQIGQMHNIPYAAQRAIAANPMKAPGSGRKLTVRNLGRAGLIVASQFIKDLRKRSIYIDCSYLNVNNIYDASLLCDHILRLKDMNILGFSTVVKSSLANIKRMIVPGEQNSEPRQEM